MSYHTPDQRAAIAEIASKIDDATIDHNLRVKAEQQKFGLPEHQRIPVSDEILLQIVLPAWKSDALEMGFALDWGSELMKKTGNQDFRTFSEADLKPYRVRAGILLERTPEYLSRMEEQRRSRFFVQTGSQIAGYIGGILDRAESVDSVSRPL